MAYVVVGNVQDLFETAIVGFGWTHTNAVFQDDVIGVIAFQDLVNFVWRSECVHLVELLPETSKFSMLQVSSNICLVTNRYYLFGGISQNAVFEMRMIGQSSVGAALDARKKLHRSRERSVF